jgi:hypothetical protein
MAYWTHIAWFGLPIACLTVSKGYVMVSLKVFDPSGATEITQLHAARLDSLANKNVAMLSDDMWQAHRMLPLLWIEMKLPICSSNAALMRLSSAMRLEALAPLRAAVLPRELRAGAFRRLLSPAKILSVSSATPLPD